MISAGHGAAREQCFRAPGEDPGVETLPAAWALGESPRVCGEAPGEQVSEQGPGESPVGTAPFSGTQGGVPSDGEEPQMSWEEPSSLALIPVPPHLYRVTATVPLPPSLSDTSFQMGQAPGVLSSHH